VLDSIFLKALSSYTSGPEENRRMNRSTIGKVSQGILPGHRRFIDHCCKAARA
jgi:hypothetical protein